MENPPRRQQPISNPHSFSSGDEGDNYEDAADVEISLNSIPNSQTITFPIRSNYSPHWSASAAFRELVQNWRDGIIQSFELRGDQFHVVKEDRSNENGTDIIFKAMDRDRGPCGDRSCLGFVRYSGQDDSGTVEITNRGAILEPKHLDFGSTTKAGNKNQAGAHGEGLKVALLVLLRQGQNHRVRCVSGNFTWNFNFTTLGKLVARLHRMAPSTARRARESAHSLMQKNVYPFAVSPLRDVKFVIGEKGRGRNGGGFLTDRSPVSLEAFNNWCKSALFLRSVPDQGGSIINTADGALILDEALQGNLYLKGLLLKESTPSSSASISGLPLKYGYDFENGQTNRDRQSVTQAKEECRAILQIWNGALQQRPDLISELSNMLLSTDPVYADVHLAKSCIKEDTATKLKNHLFADHSKWYYSDEEISKNPRLKKIIEGLGRTGHRLPDSYWALLVKHENLVRTAEQEQQKRFLRAEIVMIPNNGFSQQVERLLRSCMQGSPQTVDVNIEFVQAGQLNLHTLYCESDGLFKIHERWLSMEEVVGELGISNDVSVNDILFHAVQRLFADIIDQLPDNQFTQTDDHTYDWDRRRSIILATQRLFEYINVKSSIVLQQPPLSDSNQLSLEWNRFSSWGKEATINVQLHHKASCREIQHRLLSKNFHLDTLPCKFVQLWPDEDVKPEACFSIMLQPGFGSHSFEKLNRGSEYFAIILKVAEPDSIALVSESCVVPRLPVEIIDLTGIDDDPSPPRSPINEAPAPSSPLYSQLPSETVTTQSASRSSQTTENTTRIHTAAAFGQPLSNTTGVSASSRAVPPTTREPLNPPAATNGLSSGNRTSSASDNEQRGISPFRIGDPIESLDILEPRDWFQAKSNNVEGAIIGVPRGDLIRGRKRRRESDEFSIASSRTTRPSIGN